MGTFASPPCLMHLVDSETGALRAGQDARQCEDVARWRKAERERLIAARLALSAARRRAHARSIAKLLDEVLGDLDGLTVSAYRAFRGEPDLAGWLEGLADRGAVSALPVVVRSRAPLAFRTWRRGEALVPGVWDIPVPAAGREVVPDIVIAPVVGFDRAFYRLGYGGGFFDRTLAALPTRPRFIGVGYASQEIRTIYPQTHDVAMDIVVTEAGALRR